MVRIQPFSIIIKRYKKYINKTNRKNIPKRFILNTNIKKIDFSLLPKSTKFYNFNSFEKMRFRYVRRRRYKVIGRPINRSSLKLITKYLLKIFPLYQKSYYYLYSFLKSRNQTKFIKYVLMFNFKRKRFFPSLFEPSKGSYFFLSLGMIASRYNRGKSNITSKLNYLTTASLVRKLLLFTNLKQIMFIIKNNPTYLSELISTIFKHSIRQYVNPYDKITIEDEKFIKLNLKISHLLFVHNKPYSFMKEKKKGRLKRKIQKKVILKNRVLD